MPTALNPIDAAPELPDRSELVEVCAADDLWDGEMQAFEVEGREVLLVNLGGTISAYDGICPHQSVSLVEGTLENGVLTCRAHLWQFDARTGCGINPSDACLVRLPLAIEGGRIRVGRGRLAAR